MLHTINKSPYADASLDECLRVCDGDDVILLIEDAVYAALTGSVWSARLTTSAKAVYVLRPDAAARGMANRIAANIGTVDYVGFVQLCCDNLAIQSWY
ncbi:MAG TPA: sulfurtransferase complex subunit TusB [Spongiibacteraceae bacterium]|jgi:tRNA 2-thiouridine synthesizing protein B